MIEKMHQRYLTIEEMFSFSWDFFRLNIKTFLIFALAVGTPLFIFATLFSSQSESIETAGVTQSLLPQFIATLTGLIVTAVASGIAYLGLSYKIERSIAGVQVSFSESIQYGLGRILALIGTNILLGLALLVLFLLLIIPGIIFLVYWTFAEQAVVLRQRSAMGALNYSNSLVKGRWWRVAGVSLLIALASGIISSGIELVSLIGPDNYLLVYIVSIATYLSQLFFLVFVIVFFLNLDYLTYPTQYLAPDDPTEPQDTILDDDAWNAVRNNDNSSNETETHVEITKETTSIKYRQKQANNNLNQTDDYVDSSPNDDGKPTA